MTLRLQLDGKMHISFPQSRYNDQVQREIAIHARVDTSFLHLDPRTLYEGLLQYFKSPS